MKKLVVVESPTKARTIRAYLPAGYDVLASMGHVRDLPSSASEIPTAAKDKEWSRLGVNVEDGFRPLYVISPSRKDTIKQLKDALKEADELIIATDEDREGESIGWHLVEVLQPKVPVSRMVFHEITRQAIEAAVASPRQIDDDLVRAQETRRILDRLVGYTISPLLWKKIAPRLSAGRVQSVAVRLLVERERERHAFVSGAYWDLTALLAKRAAEHETFEALLEKVAGRRVATGRDFDEATGRLSEGSDALLLDEAEARALAERLRGAAWRVANVEAKKSTRKPYPPFTTSTLQQEAGRKLKLSARNTMRTAQTLYERGFITYHRTDSVNLSEEAIDGARRRVKALYGDSYLSPSPRRFKTTSKAAQEAHEAIRPAGGEMRPVAELGLSGPEHKLYDMIWKRTMATQMADAQVEAVTVDVEVVGAGGGAAKGNGAGAAGDADAVFKARGRRVLFPGFFRAYVEGTDDPDAALEDRDAPLPELKEGEALDLQDLPATGHETKPPARFTEAALVKALESEGIGRPSTYASIIGTIQDRGYVRKEGTTLIPTFTAFAVTSLLEEDFEQLVDVKFTARMEGDLDRIAEGDVEWQSYLSDFYSGEGGLEAQVEAAAESVDPRRASTVDLGDVRVRVGRFGPFLERGEGDTRVIAGLPEALAPADLTAAMADELLDKSAAGPESLGSDPDTNEPIYLKDGPFGPYVQRGDGSPDAKPARVSLPPGMTYADVDVPTALALLSLPRTLGDHPETGEPVVAGIGRYGPYVLYQGVYASLKPEDDVMDVGLDRGLELLAEKMTRAAGGGAGQTVLVELGAHPDDNEPVRILDGRYGPYVKHGKTNASLPKGADPAEYTMAEAVTLLAAKKGKPAGRGARKGTGAKSTAPKSTAAKGTAKKRAAKKRAAPKGTGSAG